MAAASLALGAAIYLGWRRGLLLHAWMPLPDLALPPVPELVRNVLPDALWQFSLTILVWREWWTRPRGGARTVFLAASGAFGGVLELAQAIGVLPGAFDLRDLSATVLAVAIGGAVVAYEARRWTTAGPPGPRAAPVQSPSAGREPG